MTLDSPTVRAEAPATVEVIRDMYVRVLDVAERNAFGVVLGYRANPDRAGLIGYTPDALADMQHRANDVFREVSAPYADRVPAVLIAGIVGPRTDAYQVNRTITADESEEYHSVQFASLAAKYPHLDIWGGCCGTWEVHLDEIARTVRFARRL